MSLFNPYSAFSVLGVPQLPTAPPTLRVMEGEASAAQLRAAQNAFAIFCTNARLSPVPNPSFSGRLADGSTFRIDVIGGQSIMRLWPVGGDEEEDVVKLNGGLVIGLADGTYRLLINSGEFGFASKTWSRETIAPTEWGLPDTYSGPFSSRANAQRVWSGKKPELYAVNNSVRQTRLGRRGVGIGAYTTPATGLVGVIRKEKPTQSSSTTYESVTDGGYSGQLIYRAASADFDMFVGDEPGIKNLTNTHREEYLLDIQQARETANYASADGETIVSVYNSFDPPLFVRPPVYDGSYFSFYEVFNTPSYPHTGYQKYRGVWWVEDLSGRGVRYPRTGDHASARSLYPGLSGEAVKFTKRSPGNGYGPPQTLHTTAISSSPFRYKGSGVWQDLNIYSSPPIWWFEISESVSPLTFVGGGSFNEWGHDPNHTSSGTRTWTQSHHIQEAVPALSRVYRDGSPALVIMTENQSYSLNNEGSSAYSSSSFAEFFGIIQSASDSGSGSSACSRVFRQELKFPGGKTLVTDLVNFSESASASWSMNYFDSGHAMDDHSFSGNSTHSMSYSLEREVRRVLQHDPDFGLIVYLEITYSLSKNFDRISSGVNHNVSYYQSPGGDIPITNHSLVIESKWGSRRYELIEPLAEMTADERAEMMCSRVPAVGVAPTFPAISESWSSTGRDYSPSFGFGSNSYGAKTGGGFPPISSGKWFGDENAIFAEGMADAVNFRGAVSVPGSKIEVYTTYQKCPHTGGGVLLCRAEYRHEYAYAQPEEPEGTLEYVFSGQPPNFVFDDEGKMRPFAEVFPDVDPRLAGTLGPV